MSLLDSPVLHSLFVQSHAVQYVPSLFVTTSFISFEKFQIFLQQVSELAHNYDCS